MKLLRLFPLELGRLLHSRMTWLIVLLTVISPAVGLVLYKPAIASTMLSMYLANPALAGGAAGGILFGLLTVYELDRAGRIEDVQSVCDRLVVIDHGQILFTGTPEQLIQAAEGHVGVFWEREAGQEQGLHITARVNTSQGVRCRAVADALPAYVQRSEPSLEDAYLYLISREAVQ